MMEELKQGLEQVKQEVRVGIPAWRKRLSL